MGSSNSSADRLGATDQANATKGNRNIITEAGGLSVSNNSSLLLAGAVDASNASLAGTGNTLNIGDTTGETAKAFNETMRAQLEASASAAKAQAEAAARQQEAQTLGNTDIFKTLLASQTAQTGNILSTLATQSAGSTSALSSLSRDALGQVSGLAASQQTGGVSMLNKTLLYIGLGILVVVGLFVFARK